MKERDPAMSRYVQAARRVPPLSRDEEIELATRWRRDGDGKAAERLISASLRVVVAIAISYRHYGLPFGDLVSEGNLGLMMALRKFDPARGVRFATYATYWSRAYVLGYVIKSWSMVGAGSGPLRSKLFFKLRRERAKVQTLVGSGDESASMTMLAERMGTTVERAEELTRRLDARDVSLDMQVGDDNAATLLDGLVDQGPSQEERFFDAERKNRLGEALRQAIAALDDRERFIVEHRMMADEEESLSEIGRRLGVSRERARQLEARARSKILRKLEVVANTIGIEIFEPYARAS